MHPTVTQEVIAQKGISTEEYSRVAEVMGRPPNLLELSIFGIIWSEHCSCKNTKLELMKLPSHGTGVLVKAGEEHAGVIDIGDGWAVALTMEAHNRSVATNPRNTAAAGMGSIIRKIYTTGARPLFSMTSLHLGPIYDDSSREEQNRSLFHDVLEGLANYGNRIEIPALVGELFFDDSYNANPVFNVFGIGVLKHKQLVRTGEKSSRNPVFYTGAATARNCPGEQAADPVCGKLLLEACIELLATGTAIAIREIGVGSLARTTCELAMAERAGLEIELSKVPATEPTMTPDEKLLSESLERMLIVVKDGLEQTAVEIFAKWNLPYVEVGTMTDDGAIRVLNEGELLAEIPTARLSEYSPIYTRAWRPKAPPALLDFTQFAPFDEKEALLKLLGNPTIAGRRRALQQFDHPVRPGSDAAVFTVWEANKILATAAGCNSLYCSQDPREGARIVVAEAARSLVCTGALPLAITGTLNFGNPHDPEVFWQVRECVEGLAEGCREFNTPVTGGSVSLFNETPAGAIDPTPTLGMVGIIDDSSHITTQSFKAAGDIVLLVGPAIDPGVGQLGLGASHYLKVVAGQKAGNTPRLNITLEKGVQSAVLTLINQGLIKSAHSCSEGGVAVALAECCISGEIGARIALPSGPALAKYPEHAARAALLFGESQSRIVISVAPENLDRVLAEIAALPHSNIGTVGGESLAISAYRHEVKATIAELQRVLGPETGKEPAQ